MTALAWPAVLVPRAPDVYLDARTVSGGISLSGKEQVASRDFGIWRAALTQIPIRTTEQVLAINALLARLDGRNGTVLVPMFDSIRAPWAVDSYGRVLNPAEARRQAGYRDVDGSVYGAPAGFVDTLIQARLLGAAASRAAVVSINILKGSMPQPGMHFSIGNCAYRIRDVLSVVGSVVTCNIRPGLRLAAPPGAAVNFTSPAIEMRLTTDDQGHAPLDLWRLASISLEFVEAT